MVRGSLWAFSALFAWTLMFGTYSLPRIVKLKFQKANLIEANRDLTVDLVDAIRIRKLLETDPTYIEHIARTRYFMARPNETIYRYGGR